MRRLLAHLVRTEIGSVTIELALIAPVLIGVMIGIVDVSNAFSRQLAVEQGAHRAIEKIMQTTETDTVENTLKAEAVCQVNGTNADGTCKTSPITAANVTVTYRIDCLTGSTVSSSRTTTDSTAFDAMNCATGQKEADYIEVTVTDKYTPYFRTFFSAINADGTYHVSATAGMRTQ
ncbi:pilus assembly protein [Sphingomonas piscis]|uniref:Pilus assembly protein n=1 Tax=Sphingomonas piscis TaxID=2714943 RepID=A0A6G7YRQ6_9SPHN|nr:TadE/TadG family type IV pilus assembly protein [Sphingomonas piscis]QIK79425.1 pilus assembly protein [Sphingomonas piscis]